MSSNRTLSPRICVTISLLPRLEIIKPPARMAATCEQVLACTCIQAAAKRMLRRLNKHADATLQCAICFEDRALVSFPTSCGHGFCAECTERWCNRMISCPMCRAALLVEELKLRPPETESDPFAALDTWLRTLREKLAAERQAKEAAKRPPRTRVGRVSRRFSRRIDAAIDEVLMIGICYQEIQKINFERS